MSFQFHSCDLKMHLRFYNEENEVILLQTDEQQKI